MNTTRFHFTTLGLAIIGVTVIGAGCASHRGAEPMAKVPGDGDIGVPATYRSWPAFVPTVDKVEGAQVREIYINPVGLTTQKGEAFPAGTVSVMELYAARKDAAGKLLMNAEGRLIKGPLSKIFVMAKGEGWGARLPAGTVGNGDWVYGAWQADGKTAATSDFSGCRSCHLPMAKTDFVARYDEHFMARMR
ncbi:cytochrome P460 family protein [Zoogloeaceae bacterium G21618-S1]|nr:cytochrome P460 family protein [Zoogloeaceae bacterium G21618-S1]